MKKKSRIQNVKGAKIVPRKKNDPPIQEPALKVLYVRTLLKMIEKKDIAEYFRGLELLRSLDLYMKRKGLRIVITVSSVHRNQHK